MKQLWKRIRTRLTNLLPTHNYWQRLIWLGCISVTLPLVLAGSAYYHFSMRELTTQFQRDNQESLQMMVDRMENLFTGIEHMSLQLASSSQLREALAMTDYPTDYIGQLGMLDLFLLYKNTNNLIQDIIFYDEQSQMALTHHYGMARMNDYYGAADITEAMEMPGFAGWLYLPDSGRRGYLSYVRKLPIMSNEEPQGVLLLQIREEVLGSYLAGISGQSLAIISGNGRMILDSEGGSMSGARLSDPVIQAAVADDRTTNQFITSGEEEQLVAWSRTAQGRTYISMLPKQAMIDQLGWIRVLIVVSVSIFLLIGILLSLLVSRMVYNPIQQLTQYGKHLRKSGSEDSGKLDEIEYIRSCLSYLNEQTESLNRYVRGVQPDLRERTLLQLLRPGGIKGSQSLHDECRKQGIPLTGHYVVLITKVENLMKEKRFLPSEGPVIVFAVKNVMTELLGQLPDVTGFIVDKDDREAIGIFRFPAERSMPEIRQLVAGYGERLRDALQRYLSFSVSTGIGSAVQLAKLHDSYKEAQQALQHRLFHADQTVFFYEDMIQAERQPVFLYPREIEEQMVEFLWSGDLPQAEEALRHFSARVRASESYNIIFQCYQVLLSAIVQSLEEKGPGLAGLLGDNLFDQLKECQSAQEVHDWFGTILFPLYQQVVDEIRNHSSKLIVQRVCSFIASQPATSHSLSECAELVQVSPSYLSRLFKREMGISFIEYLMKFKVEKAKMLLKETDYSVAEIAEMVGYSERNLNRAFQRFVEMSPKQYRLSLR
ncbi:helix-turn-helix domain-containing protein [Paenibacillus sp. 1P07SE]|uniref:helix-turn-helix domain-containing protein n=1 Tax=Paenibacillus sp. 1P07SE TaxID=3132209 RepID=UPI0039A52AD9